MNMESRILQEIIVRTSPLLDQNHLEKTILLQLLPASVCSQQVITGSGDTLLVITDPRDARDPMGAEGLRTALT